MADRMTRELRLEIDIEYAAYEIESGATLQKNDNSLTHL